MPAQRTRRNRKRRHAKTTFPRKHQQAKRSGRMRRVTTTTQATAASIICAINFVKQWTLKILSAPFFGSRTSYYYLCTQTKNGMEYIYEISYIIM
mmetsp:Transcript_14562/g.22178  ORF Transcript_14562/g.22178 Transcript_14562/m.22178 type:complete len:95 (+) Transcript_14562:286-570(+)